MVPFDILRFRRLQPIVQVAMEQQAEELIATYRQPNSPIDGSGLDYSEASLQIIDEILQDFYLQRAILPEELFHLVAAYVFEVTRRHYGGFYLSGDAKNPYAIMLGEPDFQLAVFFMDKIRRRASNGPADSVKSFYDAIAPLFATQTTGLHS